MPLSLRRRVASLEAIHAKFEDLEEAHFARLREIEASFASETAALFARRQRIVSGLEEPTDEEVQESAYYEYVSSIDGDAPVRSGGSAEVVGVPAFWPTVLRYCTSLQPGTIDDFAFSDADWAVLDYLVDVSAAPWDPTSEMPEGMPGFEEPLESLGDEGYVLRFTFAPNPYLASPSLSLHCLSGEVLKADVPEWKGSENDPTFVWSTRKLKKRRGGEGSVKRTRRPTESFFRIFADPSLDDSDATDEMVPLADLQEELIERVRSDAIPRAGIYYINALHNLEEDDMYEE